MEEEKFYLKDKTILIVSNPNSIFIKDLYDHVLSNNFKKVVVLSNTDIANSDIDYDYYNNCIDIYSYKHKAGIRTLVSLYKTVRTIIEKYGYFDIINYQYVGINDKIESIFLNRFGKKILYTFWGSDIFRMNRLDSIIGKYLFSSDYYYSFSSINLYEKFIEKYNKKCIKNKYYTYFGDDVIKELSKINITRKEKVINIVIGYNGSVGQRHIEVINILKKIKDKKNYIITVPVTYSISSEEYINVIEKELIATGIRYRILRKYMNKSEMAKFVYDTDIFIHNQVSDALSNTLVENLFINNYVLNTSNTYYKEFDNLNVNIHYFNTLDDILELIENYRNDKRINKKIMDIVDWDVTRYHFLRLYDLMTKD